jgi:hypothetical protein
MTIRRICSLVLGALLLGNSLSTPAFAYTGNVIIDQLATEVNGTLLIHLTTTVTTPSCSTSPAWLVLPPSNTTITSTDYATGAPLVLAAYLYNKSINLNLSGCDSLSRPIIIGIIISG